MTDGDFESAYWRIRGIRGSDLDNPVYVMGIKGHGLSNWTIWQQQMGKNIKPVRTEEKKKYPCSRCGRLFKSKRAANKHVEKEHG